jgi:dihydroorotase
LKTLISNAIIVNEGKSFRGNVIIDNDIITEVNDNTKMPSGIFDCVIDASDCYLLPGVIDDHVHFRDPGLTDKADMESESRAAAVGGVTSFFDMPNTLPQTTSLESLNAKFWSAKIKSHINYSFFFGATNTNAELFGQLDMRRIPGIKLFMGSSTGNMLVDREKSLKKIFQSTNGKPLMVHCEDTGIINRNMAEYKNKYGEDPDIKYHPLIRSEEACYKSTSTAVKMAKEYGTRLHVAHVTTARELELFAPDDDKITAEVVVGHLLFSDEDYERMGARIKVNPAVKKKEDRNALRKALNDGRIAVIGTDHAPHLITEKMGGAAKAMSGMPMIQFSLVSMLELVDEGVLTIERMVQLMCHRPASLFGVEQRGYIRKGYKADLVVVKPHTPWTVSPTCIESKCGWSPMTGHQYDWQVVHTFCNGHAVYSAGDFSNDYHGEEISFSV